MTGQFEETHHRVSDKWRHWSQDPFQVAMLQIEMDEAGSIEDIPILAEW
jgi:hypothetical protein